MTETVAGSPVWKPAPHRVSAPGLPTSVRVYEVGPRDGLQAETAVIPTETKAQFIERLVAAGSRTVELTSFVSPRWIPQLADAEELMGRLHLPNSVRTVVLVPNRKGLERAVAAGAREVAVFVSATDEFAKRNLNSTVDGAIAAAAEVTTAARALGIPVRGYISMCFGDPWEGVVSVERVADIAKALIDSGVTSLSLGDTIGVGTPGHVLALLGAIRERGIPTSQIAMHFHDTYGQALSNVYASLTAGVSEFDSSAGGLGRCPYAKGATGNLATEDLVWMLHGLGIDTGIDLDSLTDTSSWMAEQIGHSSPSRVVNALCAART
ncbi:hydroxymethylglutaryl-CoA lyase [Rhodococcus sp. (in: high G+C Gram-positive bacteria)]|uniref:hydroxymethylglutaryl-CoA lyase n=1 Tax=Rhodococcus sp. TaxID=1831 RepID=UPI001A333DB5|nr:hydroxymethylglutaryl-CoA lyase [Rhodococcus sp. (in: high G+C Gram-positive bacteria)]MBJ7480005.1 hydroxymethylglutaryl-CoA lyase [Rhodococcus sp. (in: high G+C Gram-positive bacteria)]